MVVVMTLIAVLTLVGAAFGLFWWLNLSPQRRAELPALHPMVKAGLLMVFWLVVVCAALAVVVALDSFMGLTS
ncbi:hypothetical protein C6Y44_27380 (plasmid) [Rhodococcus rhodochrous]|nr:hypothetical protein C6Y44_27380 [Rhodococcus rhodochrous]